MAVFSQEFKVQSVEKALSRNPGQSLKQIAMNLGVGYSRAIRSKVKFLNCPMP